MVVSQKEDDDKNHNIQSSRKPSGGGKNIVWLHRSRIFQGTFVQTRSQATKEMTKDQLVATNHRIGN